MCFVIGSLQSFEWFDLLIPSNNFLIKKICVMSETPNNLHLKPIPEIYDEIVACAKPYSDRWSINIDMCETGEAKIDVFHMTI